MDRYVRKNGLRRPFHAFQVLSWVLAGLNTGCFYLLTLACLDKETRILFGVFFSLFWLLTSLFWYKLSASDPTDPLLALFKTSGNKEDIKKAEEESNKYCSSCKSPVGDQSIHCMRCNRCVQGFDHHCKWVNNCVGVKNYRYFFMLILTSFGLAATLEFSSGYLVVKWRGEDEWVKRNLKEFYSVNGVLAIIVVQFCALVVNGILCCLLGYLIGFHVMLYFRGMTSYQYVDWKKSKRVMPNKDRFETNFGINNSALPSKDGEVDGIKDSDDLRNRSKI